MTSSTNSSAGSGSATAPLPGAVLDALQAALAAEHRAVFGYSVIGPRVSGADRQRVSSCQAAHETARDATALLVAAAGRTPTGPAADYPDVYPASGAAAARAVAARLEDGAATAWRYVYAAAARSAEGARLRPTAQRELTACAVRAVRWRKVDAPATAAVAFPGI